MMRQTQILIFILFLIGCRNSTSKSTTDDLRSNKIYEKTIAESIVQNNKREHIELEIELPNRDTVVVNSIKDLIMNLRSNRQVIISKGNYLLSDTLMYYAHGEKQNYIVSNKHGYYGNGGKLWISKFTNLSICGEGAVKIESNNRKVAPFSLTFSKSVEIANLYIGHTQEREAWCEDGVFNCINNSNIKIENCVFDGSGIRGVEIKGSREIQIKNSTIQKCQQNIGTISNSQIIKFEDCIFTKNGCYPGFYFSEKTDSIMFNNCEFRENFANEVNDYEPDVIFDSSTDNVYIIDCTFNNNKYIELTGLPKRNFKDCRFLDSIKIGTIY